MQKQVGLWIDHRQAVIVTIADKGEEIKRIMSDIEENIRFDADSSENVPLDDVRDRQFKSRLNRYYDDVIAGIGEATSILILGPGEAKGELEKRLDGEKLKDCIVAVETADKMTDPQIAAKVRQHFSV